MTTLTPEEEAEFTLVNALAFDYYRVAARAEGSIVPCWLCLSERARDDARRQLTVHLRASNPLYLCMELEGILGELDSPRIRGLIERWRTAELHFKELREQGNPRAFFVE